MKRNYGFVWTLLHTYMAAFLPDRFKARFL